MGNLGNFDASGVDPSTGYDPLPDDWYVCAAIESEWKDNSKGTGRYLQFTFEVIEGKHKGRRVWARLNLENPSGQAVKIAESELSAICHAVNILRPGDSSELHARPLEVKVGLRRRKDNGELTNECKQYRAAKGGAAPAPTAAAPSSNEFSDAKPAASAAPPWAR